MWAVLCHCCALPSIWCKNLPLSVAIESSNWKADRQQELFAQTWSLPQSGACRSWDVQGCNCSFCGEAGRQMYAYLFVWGSGKQLWIILVIPHYCSGFFSPTCSVNKPCSSTTSAGSSSRGLASLLGNLQVPTHRTPYISPDKTPKCLEGGLCISKKASWRQCFRIQQSTLVTRPQRMSLYL